MNSPAKVLIIDDEPNVRLSFKMALEDSYSLLFAETGREATHLLSCNSVDIILLDMILPDTHGLDWLQSLKQTQPELDVVVVSAVNEVSSAVKAIKIGAIDYILKPFDITAVNLAIESALKKRCLLREVQYLRGEIDRVHLFEKMIGESSRMQTVFTLIDKVADGTGAVLIQGETGTGKELVARAIHNRSQRSRQPFVVVNCAAIPETLIESELFGYTRGAFTGAVTPGIGKVEIADGGSVFLDDIDALNVRLQAKLLRVIQEKEFNQIGNHRVKTVNTRFIAASNKNIPLLVEEGNFREDLFFRLNVFPIHLPALKDRRADIPLLLNYFLEVNAKKSGNIPKRFTKEAIHLLTFYDWPGNVRELENLVERLFTVVQGDTIGMGDLSMLDPARNRKAGPVTLKQAVSDFEKRYISDVLEQTGGNRTKASRILGVHRNTLLAKIGERSRSAERD